jgi:predicted MPP superfamily phosphohydrolase
MAVPLFLLVFFLIYGSAHLYALAKVRTAFGFGRKGSVAVIPVLGVLCAGPVLVQVLGIHEMGLAARVASWIGYTWMGLLFFFTWLNLAMDVVNLGARLLTSAVGRGPNPLVRYGKVTCLVLVGLSVGLCAYASVEASRVRVEHVRILTDKLPASVSRLRIAQISDVHLGLMVRRRQAVAIADLVRSVQPDLVVSTGDLVDARPDHLDGLSEIFRQIPAPLGKFSVTGNHEFYAGIDASLDFTRRAGFTLLRGEAVVVGDILRIAGVDDPTAETMGLAPGRSEEEILGVGASPLFTLLLKHRPVRASGAVPQIDLQLSGHTHRGQLFPFQFLVRLAYPFLAGLHPSGADGTLYVSRGTGTWGPRMRFLSPPEITVLDVERRQTGSAP